MLTRISFFLIGAVLTTCLFLLVPTLKTANHQSLTLEESVSTSSLNAEVIYFDTDGDGEEENILLYSCQGCNAPPRELAIIDDGELVFFYGGGELQFIPVEAGVFIINETNVPRDGRRIESRYSYNKDTETYISAE